MSFVDSKGLNDLNEFEVERLGNMESVGNWGVRGHAIGSCEICKMLKSKRSKE